MFRSGVGPTQSGAGNLVSRNRFSTKNFLLNRMDHENMKVVFLSLTQNCAFSVTQHAEDPRSRVYLATLEPPSTGVLNITRGRIPMGRCFLLFNVIVGLMTVMLVSPSFSQSCSDLRNERNSIYKAAGYCFRTPRGIRQHGNAGCLYDSMADVPLSARDRQRVSLIRQQERRLGCS